MSLENVEVVRRCIEAFEHDEEAWLATVDPALDWYPIEEGHSLSRGMRPPSVSGGAGWRTGRAIRSMSRR
jgi:hypothetical protein